MELRLPSLPACAFTPWTISLTFLSLFDKGDYGVSLEVTSDKVKTGTTWWQEEPIYSTSGVSGEIPKLGLHKGGRVNVSCVGILEAGERLQPDPGLRASFPFSCPHILSCLFFFCFTLTSDGARDFPLPPVLQLRPHK